MGQKARVSKAKSVARRTPRSLSEQMAELNRLKEQVRVAEATLRPKTVAIGKVDWLG